MELNMEGNIKEDSNMFLTTLIGQDNKKSFPIKQFRTQELKKSTLEQLGKACQGPKYAQLLKSLIVQGLIKIEEKVVEIQTRAEDKAIVAGVVSFSSNKKRSFFIR